MPYVWSLVVAHGGIPFPLASIALFTPSVVPAPQEEPPLPSPNVSSWGRGKPGGGCQAAILGTAAAGGCPGCVQVWHVGQPVFAPLTYIPLLYSPCHRSSVHS